MADTIPAERMAPNAISPKTVLALMLPATGTAILVALHALLDPDIDPTLVAAIVGIVDAALAAFGAWLGAPGVVEVPPVPPTASAVAVEGPG